MPALLTFLAYGSLPHFEYLIGSVGLAMSDERQTNRPSVRKESVKEELDSLNADLEEKGAQAVRRRVEAGIEQKAKRRRSEEKPVSSGFKKTEGDT